MKKTIVIYWSGTGNTQKMAEAIAEGAGTQAISVSDFSGDISEYDAIALGCPAMGAEVLEEDEFEPFFTGIEDSLTGKTVLLFGSYGWGDGEWMRNWCERCMEKGITLTEPEGLIINETPSDDDLEKCIAAGKKISE